EGDVTAPGEVVAEAAGELVTGPLEVAAAIQATRKKKDRPSNALVEDGGLEEVYPLLNEVLANNRTLEETKVILEAASRQKREYPIEATDALDEDVLGDQLGQAVLDDEYIAEAQNLKLDNGLRIADIKPGEVATVGSLDYDTEISKIQQQLADPGIDEREVKDLNDQILKLQKSKEKSQELKGRIQGVLQEWTQQFAPDMKLALLSGDFDHFESKMGFSGEYANMTPMGNGAYLIGVNQNALENFDGTLNEKALVETVAHEFGHTLQAHLFSKADPNTRNAIFNEYKEYLRSVFQ